MKRSLLASYIEGITDLSSGEGYKNIFKYFWPELITATIFLLSSSIIDGYFISHLKSTSIYNIIGVTSKLFHFISKVAEGVLVGTVVMCGQYNGIQDYKKVGRVLVGAFWLTLIIGGIISGLVYFGAYYIYSFYGLPEKTIMLGVKLLRLKAIAVFLMFIYFAFIGFLRGIKNTKAPMAIFMIGGVIYVFFDYALIFGKFGFPIFEMYGSAYASIIQYSVMLLMALALVFLNNKSSKFCISPIASGSIATMFNILKVSWPVMVDKATLAASQLWLLWLLSGKGKYAIATYCAVNDLERLAILPALAFAQVVTFLVSNDYKIQNWDGIRSNIKKIIFMSSIAVFCILSVICLYPESLLSFFDRKGAFVNLAKSVIPVISVLVFFDLLQLILSGALRGAADVKTVMWTRLLICALYFMPASYLFSKLHLDNVAAHFVMIYGSLYIGNALMSVIYIQRFRGSAWKKKDI